MEAKYIILRDNGMWLLEMHLVGSFRDLRWTKKGKPEHGLTFNKEEAQEVIKFIQNVIDWEVAEELNIMRIS